MEGTKALSYHLCFQIILTHVKGKTEYMYQYIYVTSNVIRNTIIRKENVK